jgi:phage nucleotide-binding protein
MSFNIVKLAALPISGFSFGLFGDGGAGKTTILKTLPGEKTLYISIEGGEDVLRNHSSLSVARPEKPSEREPMVFKNDLDSIYTMLRFSKHDFSFVCLDSASELEKYFQLSLAYGNRKDIPALREYGQASELVYKYLVQFRDLKISSNNEVGRPINTFFIFSEFPAEVSKSETETTTKISPLVTGKLVKKVFAMCDVMARLEIEGNGERMLRFQPTRDIVAKCRYQSLPPVIRGVGMDFDFYGKVITVIGKEIMTYKQEVKQK